MKLLKRWLHMNTTIVTKVVKLTTVHWCSYVAFAFLNHRV
jgi:hypothetical protein